MLVELFNHFNELFLLSLLTEVDPVFVDLDLSSHRGVFQLELRGLRDFVRAAQKFLLAEIDVRDVTVLGNPDVVVKFAHDFHLHPPDVVKLVSPSESSLLCGISLLTEVGCNSHENWLFPLIQNKFVNFKAENDHRHHQRGDGECHDLVTPSQLPNRVHISHQNDSSLHLGCH